MNKEKLKEDIIDLCSLNGMDFDLIDFDHEIDSNITDEENYYILKERYNLKDKYELSNKNLGRNKDQITLEKNSGSTESNFDIFDNINPLFIYVSGSRGSGKTALSHKVVDSMRKKLKKPVAVLKYPNTELIKKLGYINIKEFSVVEYLQNVILWIDEPQLIIKKYDKKNNDSLMNLLSICRHRNITLLISTSDSRWVNKGLESYVDVWLIKDQDYQLLKSGSKIKNIIADNMLFSPNGFKLRKEEFLMYYRGIEDYQGKFRFTLPKYWNEHYSKPYANGCE
jgi:hypothetical protein